jgi:hypothetical protein
MKPSKRTDVIQFSMEDIHTNHDTVNKKRQQSSCLILLKSRDQLATLAQIGKGLLFTTAESRD